MSRNVFNRIILQFTLKLARDLFIQQFKFICEPCSQEMKRARTKCCLLKLSVSSGTHLKSNIPTVLACSRLSDSGARAKNKASERAGKKRGETGGEDEGTPVKFSQRKPFRHHQYFSQRFNLGRNLFR